MFILTFKEVSDHDDVDIAIIGAGISGLYCAYRLINDPTYSGKNCDI
ncbi:NAD(P)-binding protein [Aquimarina sp. BL5]|nr:NAD(P)-binding protein [Aquimarina sp. BL5]